MDAFGGALRPRLLGLVGWALFGMVWCLRAGMAQEIQVAYNTYRSVPFVLEGQGGLAADLVAYLNTRLKGRHVFALQTIPRERLNQAVINNPDFKGVVLFLAPGFVGDLDKTRYAWTVPILQDGNQVISSITQKVEYSGPDSLKGLVFEGLRGHRYVGLEEHFGRDIRRADVNTELQALQLVASNRADVTVMSDTVYRYLLKVYGDTEGLRGNLHVSATPHLRFERHMFVARVNAALARDLAALAVAMPTDPEWKNILAKYGLK